MYIMDADTLRDLVACTSHDGLRQALRDDPTLHERVLLHGTHDVVDAFFKANRCVPFTCLPRAVLMRRDKMSYLLRNGMTNERPIEPCGVPFVFSLGNQS